MDFEKNWTVLETYEKSKDETLLELLDDVYTKAEKYATMRLAWRKMTVEEKCAKDSLRTSLHDVFIDSLKIINRYALKCEYEPLTLSDDRKEIGDFACFIVYKLSCRER